MINGRSFNRTLRFIDRLLVYLDSYTWDGPVPIIIAKAWGYASQQANERSWGSFLNLDKDEFEATVAELKDLIRRHLGDVDGLAGLKLLNKELNRLGHGLANSMDVHMYILLKFAVAEAWLSISSGSRDRVHIPDAEWMLDFAFENWKQYAVNLTTIDGPCLLFFQAENDEHAFDLITQAYLDQDQTDEWYRWDVEHVYKYPDNTPYQEDLTEEFFKGAGALIAKPRF